MALSRAAPHREAERHYLPRHPDDTGDDALIQRLLHGEFSEGFDDFGAKFGLAGFEG